ncbi:MAG: hypothetical protein ABIQ41_07430 [Gemmatimonadales bacterium]
MRASTARFLSSDVRLFDLDFPSTGKMIARTRMAFIHLENVLAYAKRDRDGMVDAYLAAYLPEELILLFFRKGEIVNAATLRSDGRRLLPIAEALRRMKVETERSELSYCQAPMEQLLWMYTACASPPKSRFIDVNQPEKFFEVFRTEVYDGVLEMVIDGGVSFLRFSGGVFTGGHLHEQPSGINADKYLLKLLGQGGKPPHDVVAHDLVAVVRELPVQALPLTVKLFREVQGRVIAAADKELMGEAQRKHQRVSAGLKVEHPALELLSLPEYGAPPTLVVTGEELTAAFAAWTTKLLNDVELVSPGSAMTVLKEAAKENRHQLQAAGYFDRLPWRLTW